MTIHSTASVLRLAAAQISEELSQHKEVILAIAEEILRNPERSKADDLIVRLISLIQLEENNIRYPGLLNCAKAFFKAVASHVTPLIGPGALGLEEKVGLVGTPTPNLGVSGVVSQRSLDLHTPFLARQRKPIRFFEGTSDGAIAEIAAFFEKESLKQGEDYFSGEHILKVRQFGVLYQCPVLQHYTWHQIHRTVGNGETPDQIAQLFQVMVFAFETEDEDLKRGLLLHNGPKVLSIENGLATANYAAVAEFKALRAVHLAHEFYIRRSGNLFQIPGGLKFETSIAYLELLDEILMRGYRIPCLECACHEVGHAIELANILKKYGRSLYFRYFGLITSDEAITKIIIPTVLGFNRVQEIEIEMGYELDQSGEAIGVALGENREVKSFKLECDFMTENAAYRLLEGFSRNESLEKISLSQSEGDQSYSDPKIGPTVAEMIEKHPRLQEFRSVDLNRLNHIGVQAWIQALRKNRTVTYLSFYLTLESYPELRQLGRAIAENPCVLTLDLTAEGGRPDLNPFFSELTANEKLTNVGITGSRPTSQLMLEGLSLFLKRSPSLHSLRLSLFDILDRDGELLINALAHSPVRTLYFHGCRFGPRTFQALAQLLKTHPLQTLNLIDCALKNDDLKLLSQVLRENVHLNELSLNLNRFTSAGLQSLAEALAGNTTLFKLNTDCFSGVGSRFLNHTKNYL